MIIPEPGYSTFLCGYQTTELNLTIIQNMPQYSKYYDSILKENGEKTWFSFTVLCKRNPKLTSTNYTTRQVICYQNTAANTFLSLGLQVWHICQTTTIICTVEHGHQTFHSMIIQLLNFQTSNPTLLFISFVNVFLNETEISDVMIIKIEIFFSKIERHRYCDVWFFGESVIQCDAVIMAWYWSDFKEQICCGKHNPAVNYTLQCTPQQPCHGRMPAWPHPLLAVTIDVYTDTALHCGNHHRTIPPANRQSV